MNKNEKNTNREQNESFLPKIQILVRNDKISLLRNGHFIWKDIEIDKDFPNKVAELDLITQSAIKLFIQKAIQRFLLKILGYSVGIFFMLYGIFSFFSALGEALAQIF